MATKVCTKCKIEKDASEFYKCSRHTDGLASCCKQCSSKYNKKWYLKNKDHCRKVHAEYYKNNKESVTIAHKKYQELHPWKSTEHTRATDRAWYANRTEEQKEKKRVYGREYQRKNKEKIKEWHKKYRESHKEELKEYNRRYRKNNKEKISQHHLERLHTDSKFKLKEQLRNMLRCSFRTYGHRKTSRTKDIVGCDLDFLYEYLCKTWKDRYGTEWNGQPCHIDHVTPLATAKTKKDIVKLCHYTNLQLLTPKDNMAKGATTLNLYHCSSVAQGHVE